METKRILAGILAVGLLPLLALGLSQAQPLGPQDALGSAFTYQGRLTDASGPVTDLCDFQFSLWDAAGSGAPPTGGSQIGATQTRTDVAVAEGLFTIPDLDFGPEAFPGQARWLQIAVRCPAGGGSYATLAPRQALTPAPHALYAATAPWSGLRDVPPDFADGVDDDTLGGLACGPGEIAAWSGTEWVCAPDADTTYIPGTGLALSGDAFSVLPTYQLPQACGSDEIPAWNGAEWVCAPDADTTYTPGTGLDLSGDTFSLLSTYQLPQACGPDEIAAWNSAEWVCVPDADTTYTPGTGLDLSGDAFSLLPTYQLPQACADGQVAKWEPVSSRWVCADDDVGGGGAAWLLAGNAGTQHGLHVLGTTDPASLTLVVDSAPALRLEYTGLAPNVVGGDLVNSVTPGVWGGTIGGGGDSAGPNRVSDKYGTVGGGSDNLAGDGDGLVEDTPWATVGGGRANTASGGYATAGGGYYNQALGNYATIAGGGPSDIAYPDDTNNRVTDSYGTIGGGGNNLAGDGDGDVTNTRYATVGGGWGNQASGDDATVGGGFGNEATGDEATIGGGTGNEATGYAAAVGGGLDNQAAADFATIAGGGRSDVTDPSTANRVTDDYGTIGGGGRNQAGDDDSSPTSATYATVGGGYWNTASGESATVSGGLANIASGGGATVGGGIVNSAGANYATVAGGWDNSANSHCSAISGGQSNTITGTSSTISGGYTNIVSGTGATIGGGYNNTITGTGVTIGGGYSSTVTADYATIGGGSDHHINPSPWDFQPHYVTISGGYSNTVSGWSGNMLSWGAGATIGGGADNTIGENFGTIGGGYGNTINGELSTIAGGDSNTIEGDAWYGAIGGGEENTIKWSASHATIPGGMWNTAHGHTSLAAGFRAKANHSGSFVWADYTIADFASERDNQFRVRASGGARFDVNSSGWVNIYSQSAHGASVLIDTSTGAYLTTGGVWTDTSDRNAKENWAPVDGQATLARLAQLPIGTWNYKAEDPSVRRMGPTAQDFYAAFGLGGDEKAIGTVDADGVAMAAIQGLYDISQAQAGRIEVLEAETASQQAQIDELEARLGALEKRAADPASPLTRLPGAWLLLGGMVLVAGVVVQRRLPGGGR